MTGARPHLCGDTIRVGDWVVPCTHKDALEAELCRAWRLGKLAEGVTKKKEAT